MERGETDVNKIVNRRLNHTMLHAACRCKAIDIIEDLLRNEALDLYAKDKDGRNFYSIYGSFKLKRAKGGSWQCTVQKRKTINIVF